MVNFFNWDTTQNIVQFIIYIVIILSLAYVADMFLLHSIIGRGYRLFVAPGIILHELSHTLFCLLTGAKVEKIALFEKDGGSVTHGKPKLPVVGDLLISLSPFFIGIGVIYLLSIYLGVPGTGNTSTVLSANWLEAAKNIFSSLNLSSWQNWVAIYLIISIAVTMTPSWQDIRNIAFILIVLAVILVIIKLSGVQIGFSYIPFDRAFPVLAIALVFLIFANVLGIVFFTAGKILKLS